MLSVVRRILASANTLLTVMLVGVLLIMVNSIASRRYARADVSRAKLSVLSDKTVQVLKTLQVPVTATVFYQPQGADGRAEPLYPVITDMLAEYERHSDKLTVEYVEPYRDRAKAEQLANTLNIDRINVVVFQSGAHHKHLSDPDLGEYDYTPMQWGGPPRLSRIKAEDAFTSAILSVTQEQPPLIWVIGGHGEKSLEQTDPSGISELKASFEQQGFSLQAVTLAEHPDIPPEVKLILIAGPTHRFTEQEVGLLQGYLERGGKLLALIDPLNDTGLDGLLLRWGILLGRDIVVDPARRLPGVSAGNLLVTDYTQHPIVQKMQTLVTLFPLARSVRPSRPAPEGITATPLAQTSDTGWGETKTSVDAFEFKEGEDLKGPVPIAAAAERAATPAAPGAPSGTALSPTRLVVVGDSDFIGNVQVTNAGNRDFLMGAVYWLVEEERLIGIGPKPIEAIKLTLTDQQLGRIRWLSFLGMPLLCGALGVGVWALRRK